MTVSIKNVDYAFEYKGFGPLYTFESIAKRTLNPQLVGDMHLLIYATLLHCNPGKFRLGLEEFFQVLYDVPSLEAELTKEIVNAWKQRMELSHDEQKKSE